jgi:hypothetical protein
LPTRLFPSSQLVCFHLANSSVSIEPFVCFLLLSSYLFVPPCPCVFHLAHLSLSTYLSVSVWSSVSFHLAICLLLFSHLIVPPCPSVSIFSIYFSSYLSVLSCVIFHFPSTPSVCFRLAICPSLFFYLSSHFPSFHFTISPPLVFVGPSIRDPEWKKIRIPDKHLGFATLLASYLCFYCLYTGTGNDSGGIWFSHL